MDRRLVIGVVALALVLPRILPLRLPGLAVTAPVRSIHEKIESLPPRARVMISLDFDPSSQAELEPQARAVIRHAMRHGLSLVAVCLVPTGRDMALKILRDSARETGAKEGESWAFLGWQPGGPAAILGLAQDIPRTFPKDARGVPTASLPMMRDVLFLKDFHLMVAFGHSQADLEAWILYGQGSSGYPMAAGTSAVNAAGLMPFLQSGQLIGLMNGLKGAAEYEKLLGRDAAGTAGMNALGLGALAILGLVVLANLREMRKP